MFVLAFDYGLRNIGVAIGQRLTGTATPLTGLAARDGIPNWAQVQTLLEEWRPQQLLVGLPLNMDASESELSRRARKFANRLHGRFGLTVNLMDERLSSFEVKQQAKARARADEGQSCRYAPAPFQQRPAGG